MKYISLLVLPLLCLAFAGCDELTTGEELVVGKEALVDGTLKVYTKQRLFITSEESKARREISPNYHSYGVVNFIFDQAEIGKPFSCEDYPPSMCY